MDLSIGVLYRSRNSFSLPVRKKLVLQLILSILDYADAVYQAASKMNPLPPSIVYNRLCRCVLDCPYITHRV